VSTPSQTALPSIVCADRPLRELVDVNVGALHRANAVADAGPFLFSNGESLAFLSRTSDGRLTIRHHRIPRSRSCSRVVLSS